MPSSKKSEAKTPKSEKKLRSFTFPNIGEGGTVIKASTREEANEKAAQLEKDIGPTVSTEESES